MSIRLNYRSMDGQTHRDIFAEHFSKTKLILTSLLSVSSHKFNTYTSGWENFLTEQTQRAVKILKVHGTCVAQKGKALTTIRWSCVQVLPQTYTLCIAG